MDNRGTIFDCHWKRLAIRVWTQNEAFYCLYHALFSLRYLQKDLQREGSITLSKYDTHYGS